MEIGLRRESPLLLADEMKAATGWDGRGGAGEGRYTRGSDLSQSERLRYHVARLMPAARHGCSRSVALAS